MRRFVILFLSVCMLFVFMSCSYAPIDDPPDSSSVFIPSPSQDEDPSAALSYFTLPYKKDASLNPIITDSNINRLLGSLLFDSLVKLDENFQPVKMLAESILLEKLSCTVTIRKGVKFTDGSALTSKDVAASYNEAKSNGKSNYAQRFTNVEKIEQVGDNQVLFTLKKADPFFVNLLDLPILKAGTCSSDNATGSGRYRFLTKSGVTGLEANGTWAGGDIQIKQIPLYNVKDTEIMLHSLEMGDLSFIYTEDPGNNRINAASLKVSTGIMGFLGVNLQNGSLADRNLRTAVRYALDRSHVVNSLNSSADYASGPFPSAFYPVGEQQKESESAKPELAVKALEAAGYQQGKNNYAVKNGKTLQLRLLYLKSGAEKERAAQEIATDLKKVGIDTAMLPAASQKTYDELRKKGEYDLFLGEIALTPNMDLSPLLTGGAGKIPGNSPVIAAYHSFCNGDTDLAGFLNLFSEENVYYPLFFRNGTAAYARQIKVGIRSTASDIFFNIEEWVYG